jgi:hypothetical protein
MNNNPYPTQQPPSGPYPSNPGYPPQGQQGPYTQYPQQPGYPPPGYQQPPMPPMQQPQQQQAPKKKKNKLAIGCGSVVALVVLIAIISAVNSGGKGSTAPTTPSSSGSSNTTNSAPPAAPQTWQTTHTYSGSGNQKTAVFTAADDWKINWTCTPGSFDGMSYNVIVDVDNSDGTPADPAAINATCQASTPSGTTEEHQGGTVYLDIQSESAWTVTVQELK